MSGASALLLGALVGGSLLMATGCDSPAPAQQEPERGEYMFNNYCTPCHDSMGQGKKNLAAPSIAGLPEWYVLAQLGKFRTGARGTHFDDLEGMRMRPMALALQSQSDVKAVASFVSALPVVHTPATVEGGDVAKGKSTFGTCAACHGADAKGNEAMGAPNLTVTPDWYLLKQLGKFKAGVRGSNPADTTGATMRPMAQGLADEQAMKDVVAYIQTLRK